MKILNQRRFKRIRAAVLVKYRANKQEEPRVTNARDLSAGGVRFWTEEKLQESSVLEIQIYFPPLERFVDTLAEVIRVRKTKREAFYFVAVRFLDLKEKDREAIDQFADALAQEQETQFLIDHAEVVVRQG